MSKRRPTLGNAHGEPCMANGTAYLMILKAIENRPGLVHGRLQDHGEYCAIGSYFHINAGTCLPSDLIDEVASVNDSVPQYTERQRKLYVRRWLRWKLARFGMPGFKMPIEAKPIEAKS